MTEHSPSHGHDHGHDHGLPHSHDHAAHAGERRLMAAAVLTGGFMLAEIVGGVVSGSLALLADAGHMFVDFAGLALAFFAIRLAKRPANARKTYGYDRFQILVAYSNGLVLFGVAGVIVFEAWRRLSEPVPILGGPMLAVAVAGLAVNVAAFAILHGGDREDLNLRGALLHVAGDMLGSVAAIAASLVIMGTGWTPIDPILSVLVALLILGNAYGLVRDAAHILLEGAPEGMDAAGVGAELQTGVAGLSGVHHVHVWALSSKRRAATLHARIAEDADAPAIVRAIKRRLAERYGIDHATVEVEHGACADDAHHGDAGHDHEHDHGPSGHARHAQAPCLGAVPERHGPAAKGPHRHHHHVGRHHLKETPA